MRELDKATAVGRRLWRTLLRSLLVYQTKRCWWSVHRRQLATSHYRAFGREAATRAGYTETRTKLNDSTTMTLPLVVVVVRVTTPNLNFFLNGAIRVTGHEIPSRGLTVDLLFFPSSRRDG